MNILVSGLLNMETTVATRGFPINYYPIDYSFYGVKSAPSGVAYNISLALSRLGNNVRLCSILSDDFASEYIKKSLEINNIKIDLIKNNLSETPASAVLFSPDGRRQIYCDLKNIQETEYGFDKSILSQIDLVVACNINFNRPLLHLAKEAGKVIATDVHVLSDINDEYNRDFVEKADILFLSDEAVGDNYSGFILEIASRFDNKIIVMGRGEKGAAIYTKESGEVVDIPAYKQIEVVNTVGAGDALFSSFIHYYSKGFSPYDSLRRAVIFAALKIRHNGASQGFVTEDEVEALI